MAAIQNERDKLLQAAAVRFIPPVIDPSLVNGVHIQASDTTVLGPASGATSPATITLTATLTGDLTGTVVWSVVSGTATLSGSGNTRTVTGSTMSMGTVVVRAQLTQGGQTYEDRVVLTKIKDQSAIEQDIDHLMNTSPDFSIRTNGLVFTNTSGTTTPSTITLTAVRGQGLTGGTVNWSVFAGSATLSTATGESTVVTGSTVSGRSVTIRARLTIDGVNHDAYVTITRLGAIAAVNAVNLTSQVTGQLASSNVSGLGALALLNVVNLNTQTTGTLNGITQVTNLGDLAYANSIAANQIGAGTLAAGVIYAGVINANQVNSGSFAGKTFTGGTFTGALFRTAATGRRIEIDVNDIEFIPPSGSGRTVISSPTASAGLNIVSQSGGNPTTIHTVGSGEGLRVTSSLGTAILAQGGNGVAIRIVRTNSLPSDRSEGNICFYGGWVCFANGTDWYRSDGTKLT